MKRTAVILVALSVASCGTTNLSSEELSEVRAGSKAIVTSQNQPLIADMIIGDSPIVKIIAVDGRKLGSEILARDEQIAVDVGVHRIEFSCADRAGYNEKDFEEVIELDLKPHHRYLVSCSFDSRFGPDGTYVGSFDIEEEPVK